MQVYSLMKFLYDYVQRVFMINYFERDYDLCLLCFYVLRDFMVWYMDERLGKQGCEGPVPQIREIVSLRQLEKNTSGKFLVDHKRKRF